MEWSVFIIPPLLSDGGDLLATNWVDVNRGPFGEPFHHLNSTASNSHDLMRCRMPEICCSCFLFSPSTLFSSTATEIHNRKMWLTIGSWWEKVVSLQFRLDWNLRTQKHICWFIFFSIFIFVGSLFSLIFERIYKYINRGSSKMCNEGWNATEKSKKYKHTVSKFEEFGHFCVNLVWLKHSQPKLYARL